MNEKERFHAFVAALEQLCLQHKVSLSTSGYDGLQVWPLSDEPLHVNGIENKLDLEPRTLNL